MDVVTTPLQLIVDGLVGFLGLLAIGVLFGLVALKDSIIAYPHFWLGVVLVAYLIWLLVTICDLVEDEVVSSWTHTVSEEHGGDVAHRVLTKQDYVAWAAGTFFIWMTILAASGAWLARRILV